MVEAYLKFYSIEYHPTINTVVSVAGPMRKVSWMLYPGGTELGTQVKTGSRAGHTHTLDNPQVECTGVCV